MFLIIIYFIIILTSQFAFSMDLNQLINSYVYNFGIILFILDILINLNSGYYYKGNIENDRRKIIIKFIKNDFVTEILSLVAIFCSLNNYDFYKHFINILILLKLGRIQKIIKKIEERFDFEPTLLMVVSLTKIMFTIFLISHLFSCIYLKFGIYEKNHNETNWMTDKKIDNLPFISQYITAYYFIMVTMITVGYGDFYPVLSKIKIKYNI